jgi:hypothetical protein
MLNADLTSPGIPVFFPVSVSVGGTPYGRMVSGTYSAKQSKAGILTGSAK